MINLEKRICFVFLWTAAVWLVASASHAGISNLVHNFSFEQTANGFPDGWVIDKHTAGKGQVLLDRQSVHSGRQALKLIPNDNNKVAERPFGVTQFIPAGAFKGKEISIQSAMQAVAGAEANVVVFEMSKEGKLIKYIVLSSFSTEKFKVYRDTMKLSDDVDYLIVNCSTSSRKGEVIFDDLVIQSAQSIAAPNQLVQSGK